MRCEKIREETDGIPNFLHAVRFFPESEKEKGERALLAIGLATLEMAMGEAPFKCAEMAKEALPADSEAQKQAFFMGLKASQNKLTREEALQIVKSHIDPHWEKGYPMLNYDYVHVPNNILCVKLCTAALPESDHFYVSMYMFAPNDEKKIDRLHRRIQEILNDSFV